VTTPPDPPADSGAEERLDPFARLSPFSIDHLARYSLASRVVRGRRVLDAACGTGFGAWILAEAGARQVDALDGDAGALEEGRARYHHPAIHYAEADLEDPEALPAGPWEVVCCFETLEHLRDPRAFLAALRPRLAPGAILLFSVPGEADATEANPFHLHRFTATSFAELLTEFFPAPRLLAQHFGAAVAFGAETEAAPRVETLPLLPGTPAPATDGYLALIGESLPPDLLAPRLWLSRAVWHALMNERRELHAQCRHFAEAHREVFEAHADLQRKFSVCLAWGQYYHHQVEHKDPVPHFLDALQAQAYAEVQALRADLDATRRRLVELEQEREALLQAQPDGLATRRRLGFRDFLQRWRRR
jgi:SAM-dependent methyltransferase